MSTEPSDNSFTATTRGRPFCRVNAAGQHLLSTNNGIPAVDAIDEASSLLACACGVLELLIEREEGKSAGSARHAALQLIEFAQEILASCTRPPEHGDGDEQTAKS